MDGLGQHLCFKSLCECSRDGILSVFETYKYDDMKLNQWLGDSMLNYLVHQRVRDLKYQVHNSLASMAKWAQLAMRNETLARLYDEAHVGYVLKLSVTMMKRKGDIMEAVIYFLHEAQNESETWKRESAGASLVHIINCLLDLAKQTLDYSGFSGTYGFEARPGESSRQSALRQAQEWLASFQCPQDQRAYTHSSLRGATDFLTKSGRLQFPDTPDVRGALRKHIVCCYENDHPLAWVEMATPHHPFFEDIDVLAGNCLDGPPVHILDRSLGFWEQRAYILKTIFPDLVTLELSLFTAHGWSSSHNCFKASYHAIWPDIIVDKERANVVRLTTLRKFEQLSKNDQTISGLLSELQRADGKNEWASIFDQSSVFGGSFRLPYCDKIEKRLGRRFREGRPILPCGVWRFTFDSDGLPDSCRQLYSPSDLSKEQWLERGSVRRADNPPLPRYKPVGKQMPSNAARPSSRSPFTSSYDPRARWQRKEMKEIDDWNGEQRSRRRHWDGTAEEFHRWICWYLHDVDAVDSAMAEIPAKPGKRRFLWTHRGTKGAIEVQELDGEVFIRGNAEQQLYLLHLVKQFTSEWNGKVPVRKATKKAAPAQQWHSRSSRAAWSGHGWASGASCSWPTWSA